MKSVAALIQQTHARGGKITPQRLLIYEVLEGNTQHPTAEAVHARVVERMPMVSLTTVYKALNELVAYGDLKRFDVDGVTHFDPNTNPHGEAICLKCGRIADVACTTPDAMAEVSGFHVTGSALTFYGHCAQCHEELPMVGDEAEGMSYD